VTVGADFHETHRKIRNIVQCPVGVNAWAAWHNTKFGPARYQLVDMSQHRMAPPFQPKKRVLEPRFRLRLGPHIIKSLRWKEQGASALSKDQVWLAQVGRLTRTSRGICVGPMRRFYLGACVPHMLYAADIFLNPHTFKLSHSANRAILAKLRTIQRRAVLAVTGVLSLTPPDVLDAYANLLPVRFLVERVRYWAALGLATLPATHPLH
ncbi:hypothetical protein C8R45DRAFT_832236, partial [Mycena sanguinolenta]